MIEVRPKSLLQAQRFPSEGRYAARSNDRYPPMRPYGYPRANHSAGADAFADSVAPAIREAQAAGAKTLRQIAAALNGRGIGTARGGKWEATTVANVLRRVGRVSAKGVQSNFATATLHRNRSVLRDSAGPLEVSTTFFILRSRL